MVTVPGVAPTAAVDETPVIVVPSATPMPVTTWPTANPMVLIVPGETVRVMVEEFAWVTDFTTP